MGIEWARTPERKNKRGDSKEGISNVFEVGEERENPKPADGNKKLLMLGKNRRRRRNTSEEK